MPSAFSLIPIVLGVFYVFAILLLGYGLLNARRSTRAAKWPTTPATMTYLDLVESSNDDSSSYKVQVGYTYIVDGQTYKGDRLAFGYRGTNRPEEHEETHRKLRDAQQVNARYDPSNPSSSCLSFGIHRSIQTTLATAATLWLILAVMTLGWFFTTSPKLDSVLLKNLSVQ